MEKCLIVTEACCIALLAAGVSAHAASLSRTDKDFMTSAARMDMIEAHEGQMAESQATRAEVKDFAKGLVQDHSQSYGQLTNLSAKMGVAIPKGINSGKDRTIGQLVSLKGNRFDRQFASDEVVAAQHEIAVFKREAQHGQDPAVKTYAKQMIPILENDLKRAEACAKPAGRT